MKATLKAQWLAALRSGQYRQGRFVLRTWDNTYCCLGVLADVVGVRWIAPPPAHTSCFLAVFAGTDETNGLRRSTQVPKSLGLSSAVQQHLMAMNDETGASFHEIAAWIDANIPCTQEENGCILRSKHNGLTPYGQGAMSKDSLDCGITTTAIAV